MTEVKVELIKLLKFPVAVLTIVLAVLYLDINLGNLKEAGPGGLSFYPDSRITSIEKSEVTTNNNLDVSLPDTSNRVIEKVKESTYSDTPSSEGWVYLGTFRDGSWNDRLIEISDFLVPEVGKSYVVIADSISVRTGKPQFPLYNLKQRIGFTNKDDLLKVIKLDTNLGKNRVWAKVEAYSKTN